MIENIRLSGFVFLFLATILVSCNGPQRDAREVCDCWQEAIGLIKDKAPVEDFNKKNQDCISLTDEFKKSYEGDSEKIKELDQAIEECSQELTDEYFETILGYQSAKK